MFFRGLAAHSGIGRGWSPKSSKTTRDYAPSLVERCRTLLLFLLPMPCARDAPPGRASSKRKSSMPMGLLGRKCGMTRVFTEAGVTVPVTVIEVLPNRVTQVKIGGSGRLSRRAGQLWREAPAAAVQCGRRSLRQGEGRPGTRADGVPPRRERGRRACGRLRGQGRPLQGRRCGRCDRHDHRQGLCRAP